MTLTVDLLPKTVELQLTPKGVEVDISKVQHIPMTLQNKSVTPTGDRQIVQADDGYDALSEVAVEAVPGAVWDDGSTITVDPILTVDYNTGEISAGNNLDAAVSPIAVAGFATPSQSLPVHVRGNAATQLYTLDGQTYTPTKATQTIEAGRLLTGDQIIAPIPDNYYDMSNPMSWLGKEVELLDDSVYSKSDTLANTGFNGWTPSTTASTIVTAVNAKTFAADMANYQYYLIWECACDMAYTGTPTLKAHFLFSRAYLVQEITKRPSTFANVQNNVFDGNNCTSLYTANFLRYYGTTTGSITYSWSASYGVYFGATAATFSNSTSDAPNVTIKTPTLATRCSTTYFSTGNAAKVDQANSKWSMSGKLYRIKKDGIIRNIFAHVASLVS